MGFQKEILREGSGPNPTKGQTVTVHCTGIVKATNKKFWSTHDTNETFSFQIGMSKVIRGWDEGVLTMKVGELARLDCTPDYAYGAGGFPAWGIPPNADLIFEVEVMKIN
eukprot:GCRY01001724.1.p1 GENE.GCRY01001724.1~~GCRY01001724.1.p1  ORF type:complete len:110 (+),score=13.14 GCRY01001724.1:67-396(+)